MSTLSSSLNSSATAVLTDFVMPARLSMTDRRTVTTTRWLTIAFGVVQIAIGIWAQRFDDSVITNALAIAGFSSGLLLGLFAIGTFLKQANQTIAMVGLCFGLVVLVLVRFVFGDMLADTGWEIKVAWPWLPVIGSVSVFASAWIATFFIACNSSQRSDRL
ncbi:MAG: hypothetical protein KDB27_31795, partial [Planctomycetales bacterium]|nr:hypothetical protein [Planctomycetales bacterium]